MTTNKQSQLITQIYCQNIKKNFNPSRAGARELETQKRFSP